MKQLAFIKNGKPVRYKIDAVELEKRIDEIIPDIVVVCDGKKFIVEIYVTHAVDEKKKEKIKSLRLSAVEINLSQFRHQMLDKEMLIKELYNTRNIISEYTYTLIVVTMNSFVIRGMSSMTAPIVTPRNRIFLTSS